MKIIPASLLSQQRLSPAQRFGRELPAFVPSAPANSTSKCRPTLPYGSSGSYVRRRRRTQSIVPAQGSGRIVFVGNNPPFASSLKTTFDGDHFRQWWRENVPGR